ncbi:MAG TPA: hypothetical protein DHU78_02110 [Opitutae bacterium]|nr:hypothetical protein [Opitutae bacterium]|tara:strand:+ start:758 stop:1051 length:294 start_codon:yes stop_codon:yes gene_type:complete
MKSQPSFFKFFLLLLFAGPAKLRADQDSTEERFILLQGLSRTNKSVIKVEAYFKKKNFQILNLSYPSRKFKIERLSQMFEHKSKNCLNQNQQIKSIW